MKRTAAAILPLLMSATLGACANSDETPVEQLAPTKQAQIEKREQQFVVAAGRTADLSPASRSGFDRFIADAAAGRPQSVHITLFGGAPQTATALRQAAIADGVNPAKIEIKPTEQGPSAGKPGTAAAQTTVVATTYVMTMPSCASHETEAFSRAQSPAWSDFGCSVNSTLAAMVDDPHDLIQGQTGGETDSVLSGAAIDRLLQDKVKKFDTQSFSPGGAGGGGGAP